MSRFKRSWGFAKTSWGVLLSEKQLMWFPVLSFLASIAVVIAVGVAALMMGDNSTDAAGVAVLLLLAAAYIAVAYVQTYFLAALCGSANEKLQGRDTTLGHGIKIANSRLGRILGWAVLTATVSMILEVIEERLGFLGAMISGLIGAAWNVVTFLTVPIIVFEDVGPVNALKRSGTLLKKTWGENVIAQGGIGLVGLVAMIPGGIAIWIGVSASGAVIKAPAVAVGLLWCLVVMAVMSALSGIYRTALYRYAVDGQVPEPFLGSGMEQAFGARKGKSGS